jgi:hypothetical protein
LRTAAWRRPAMTIDAFYGLKQSASAGPGEPLQVAASLLPIFLIWIAPPGQVTETSFSSVLQMSSHLVSQAGWLSARNDAGPGGPGGPAGPAGPVVPTAPVGPSAPGRPAVPGTPGRPCGPWAPGGPAGPGAPGGPCGPSKHPASEKAAISAATAMDTRIDSPDSVCHLCPQRFTAPFPRQSGRWRTTPPIVANRGERRARRRRGANITACNSAPGISGPIRSNAGGRARRAAPSR